MLKLRFLLPIIILSLLLIQCKSPNPIKEKANKDNKTFNSLNKKQNWTLVFEDECTTDWQENWTLDGLIARVENSKAGMLFTAGPEPKNDAHHAVLWTKESFSGNIKIEYDLSLIHI